MNVVPSGVNQAPAQTVKTSEYNTPAKQDARQRAIEMITKGGSSPTQPANAQPNQPVVQNATQVSPEELSAVKAPSQEPERQKDTSDKSSEARAETKAKNDEKSLASQYALMARKEKAIRAKQQELKAQEDAIKAKEAAFITKDAEYNQKYIPKDRITQDTLGVLNDLGITYDQLTQLILKSPTTPQELAQKSEFQRMADEIKALRESQEANKKMYEDGQKQAYSQAVNQIKVEAQQLVRNNPTFETIQATNSISDVVELIEKTFKEDGVLLTVEDACNEVENYLVDEALKLSRLKKIQARLAPKQQPSASSKSSSGTEKSQQQPQMKTLTNANSAQRPLTARECAMLAFENKLGK